MNNVHTLPLPPSAIQRQAHAHIRNTAEAIDTAHSIVWFARDACPPDVMLRAALGRAEAALVDAALCMMALQPRSNDK